ncbi:MAG: CHRD domain-containing protein [Betaproteobacteria bacterium]
MKFTKPTTVRTLIAASALILFGACTNMGPMKMAMVNVAMTGANEVPPVSTTALGTGTVTVKDDKSVTAKITITGMTTTAAHIHMGAAGANGPVIVPFTRTADNTFEAPPGAKLSDAQYDAYKAGNLYVNAHSNANPGGEVRAQLKP